MNRFAIVLLVDRVRTYTCCDDVHTSQSTYCIKKINNEHRNINTGIIFLSSIFPPPLDVLVMKLHSPIHAIKTRHPMKQQSPSAVPTILPTDVNIKCCEIA